MLVWTPALEADCPPRRGEGEPITSPKKPPDAKKLFAEALKHKLPRASLKKVVAGGEGTLVDEADAYLLACGGKSMEKVATAIVDRWVQRYGAAKAIEIFTHVGRWTPSVHWAHGAARYRAAARLRCHLAHAADYDDALAFAKKLDVKRDLPQWQPNKHTKYNTGREVIAYLFPDHRPFFDAAAKSLVAENWVSSYLVGAMSSRADFDRITLARIGFEDLDWNAIAFARVAGEDAIDPLVEYSGKSSKVLGVAKALSAFATPAAAQGLTLYLANKKAYPLLHVYFGAHRKLAMALTPHLTSAKKPIREAAKQLLG